jgi:hypothetical protein
MIDARVVGDGSSVFLCVEGVEGVEGVESVEGVEGVEGVECEEG